MLGLLNANLDLAICRLLQGSRGSDDSAALGVRMNARLVTVVVMSCLVVMPCNAGIADSFARAAIRAVGRSSVDNALSDVDGARKQTAPNTVDITTPSCRRFTFTSKVIRTAEFCQLTKGSYLDISFVNLTAYRYFDVPVATYDAFVAASSAGRFFNSSIRYQYRCERISQSPRVRSSQGCE